jgi:AraC-like DNA-binding protein
MSKITISDGGVKYPEREFATAIITEDCIPFKSAVIGITYPTKDYVIRRDLSEVIVFEYILEGEGELFINGEWKKVKAGDVYILNEGEAHYYRASNRNPWKKIWINYESSYMAKMLASYKIESGIYSAENVRARFEDLLECSRNAAVSQNLCFFIADSLHRIINEIALERVPEKNDGRMIIESVEEYVYKKLSLDELSASLNMSKSNIIRVFKKEYGITPYEYLLSRKMSAAKLLLENTSMTVKQIADKICISDEHYFSSLFLARVGMRPRDYRNKKIRGKNL